jgi:hypothetical protein
MEALNVRFGPVFRTILVRIREFRYDVSTELVRNCDEAVQSHDDWYEAGTKLGGVFLLTGYMPLLNKTVCLLLREGTCPLV